MKFNGDSLHDWKQFFAISSGSQGDGFTVRRNHALYWYASVTGVAMTAPIVQVIYWATGHFGLAEP